MKDPAIYGPSNRGRLIMGARAAEPQAHPCSLWVSSVHEGVGSSEESPGVSVHLDWKKLTTFKDQ